MRLTSGNGIWKRSAFLGVLVAGVLAGAPAVMAACGNGTIEPGEDCDDGSQNGTTNSCCTSSCTFSGKAPDVIVGDLVGTTNWGTVSGSGITAYSVGTTSCNIGSCWLNWISSTAEHPVIGQNMFRLKDGRFEQVGQSWLKHGFTALAGNVCSNSCVTPPSGAHLGVNCSDPYDSGLNGTQTRLGPKNDVNPNTGVFLFPDSRESLTGNAIYKRLQVHNTDLDPALNVGALYFVEGQYVTHDDATAKNNPNNASYRAVAVGASPYNITLQGTTQRQKAGIQAWKATDPTVTETILGAPEGEFIISAKVTNLGGGIYHYEYAVQNLNNNRAAQAFTVPLPAGATVTNIGFHDVDYHSNAPADQYDGTDWPATVGPSSITWATQTYAVNQMANALRWGTLYNFRFDTNVAPGTSSVVITLFKPGSPTTANATTVTPGTCGGAPDGTACNDNNACTLTDTCTSGLCVGSNPIVCTASDACHNAGTCDAATGVCSNPAKPNGTACSDGNACTQTDACQAGVCQGSNPVVCTASDSCHLAGVCNTVSGVCSNPAAPDGSGCSDGNACTQTDACQAGVCQGSNPVLCTASDVCHVAGTCDSATGACSNPAATDGTPCDDANACTQTDGCQGGVCRGSNPVVCTASDACHVAGTCDTSTGACSNPAAPDGTPCFDGNLCTQTDLCATGACIGSNEVVCAALDACHDVGVCDSGTGSCSNPVKADNSPCDDGNACTTNDVCTGGSCAGQGQPAPPEVDDGVLVFQDSGVSTISWNPAPGSTSSTVLRGFVSALPVGPGGGDEVCLQSGITGSSFPDADDPGPDQAFWYLIVGENACGLGPYGFEVDSGVQVPRVTTTCP